MRTVSVLTGTRADYGLLRPLMARIAGTPDLGLHVLATGMHLAQESGRTLSVVEADGWEHIDTVDARLGADSATGVCASMGHGLAGCAEVLERVRPALLVILGDRWEAFCAAAAAVVCRIPVAHIHGGESTQGVIDEPFRHCITKMSLLHFASTADYRRRIIQLGEAPERVFDVGALGVENILGMELLERQALAEDIGFDLDEPYFLVTFHPATMEPESAARHCGALLGALDRVEARVIFTKGNQDTGGRVLHRMIDEYVAARTGRAVAFTSLGQLRYLSAMQYTAAVVGNSSSGILEAPVLGVPAVDVGDRQRGRILPGCVLHCAPDEDEITTAIVAAMDMDCSGTGHPYGDGATSSAIVERIRAADLDSGVLKKAFFDLPLDAFARIG